MKSDEAYDLMPSTVLLFQSLCDDERDTHTKKENEKKEKTEMRTHLLLMEKM